MILGVAKGASSNPSMQAARRRVRGWTSFWGMRICVTAQVVGSSKVAVLWCASYGLFLTGSEVNNYWVLLVLI